MDQSKIDEFWITTGWIYIAIMLCVTKLRSKPKFGLTDLIILRLKIFNGLLLQNNLGEKIILGDKILDDKKYCPYPLEIWLSDSEVYLFPGGRIIW